MLPSHLLIHHAVHVSQTERNDTMTITTTTQKATITRNVEFDEHVVKFYKLIGGGWMRDMAADYFTDDKQDAIDTANAVLGR